MDSQMKYVPVSLQFAIMPEKASFREVMATHQEGIMSETIEQRGQVGVGTRKTIVQVALASLVGTMIEWYDFYLYGTATALVFNTLFFPTLAPLAGTLAAFATFWVGFGARPVGGIVFGHFGDRIGRKSMLVFTLLLMGVATFLIGFLPTYAIIGVWAPILLVVLRFVQGFAVGGEWGGAVLLATEYSPGSRRGFFGSWPQSGAPAGLVLATGIFSLVTVSLSHQQFLNFGWRVPFLLSFLLVIVGLFIRLKVQETPEFQQVKQTQTQARVPLFELLRTNWRQVLLATGAFIADVGGFYLFTTYVLNYGTVQLKMPQSVVLNATLIASALFFFAIPAAAALSDQFGRRPVYLAGIIYTGIVVFPFFWLFESRSPGLVVLALCLAVIGLALMHGPQAAFFSEMFGTRVRYSGASLGYQLGSVLGGGLMPFIATALFSAAHSTWPISLYLIGLALVSLISVILTRETRPTLAAESIPAAEGSA
jgi:MFS transporter, MHS family, shikimate and dehydroshikimate transport protein